MKKIILVAFSLVSVSFALLGQSKSNANKVFWVHGLGDDSSTWINYRNALVNADHRGVAASWSISNSLDVAADALNNDIEWQVSSSKNAIVFGHSAGGLVARKAATLPGNKIRAIITAGTPNNNDGAQIAYATFNNSLNNVAEKAISKAETSIALGSIACGSLLPKLLKSISVLLVNTDLILADIGKSLADEEIEDYKRSFSGKRAVYDLSPNSYFLRTLNATQLSVPIINFYGNEDANRLVRIAGTAMHKTENDTNTEDKNFDQTAFPYYNEALALCTSCEVLHAAVGTLSGVFVISNPTYLASSALNISAAVSWSNTRRYIQYDVHNEWDSAIGATHIDRIENWHKFLWKKWCDVEFVTVYENSDGFIPNKSSKMTGSNVTNIEVKGVNHLEMNSHVDMRKRLVEVYNGNYGVLFDPKYN